MKYKKTAGSFFQTRNLLHWKILAALKDKNTNKVV